jgi:hypothetical protein
MGVWSFPNRGNYLQLYVDAVIQLLTVAYVDVAASLRRNELQILKIYKTRTLLRVKYLERNMYVLAEQNLGFIYILLYFPWNQPVTEVIFRVLPGTCIEFIMKKQ